MRWAVARALPSCAVLSTQSRKDIVNPALGLGVASLDDASTQKGLLQLYDSVLASTEVVDVSGNLWLTSFMEAERKRGASPGWTSTGLPERIASFVTPG